MPERIVEAEAKGLRLDTWLARALPEHSRSRWQHLVETGQVRLNGGVPRGRQKLSGGETVTWTEPPPEPAALEPEARALDILYEDADLLVLNKPPGMTVHPAPGVRTGTLVNALLAHCDDLSGIGGEERPGIVHRLDRDTSGAMVVAKTEAAHRRLADQFRARAVHKVYLALVWGRPAPPSGVIRLPIARDPHHRQRMSARVAHGRAAVTQYETTEVFERLSLLRVGIETGRTHQIRVHLAQVGHPVAGDALYGRRARDNAELGVARQMLHAFRLSFEHPGTGEPMVFEAEVPGDFRDLLGRLRREERSPSAG
jgi:23S rRNA pseudouridine1911/1915/1917 synthase